MHLNDKNTLCEFLSFKCILACMSRDFDIFMSKHLAGQWLLNSYEKTIKLGQTDTDGTLYDGSYMGIKIYGLDDLDMIFAVSEDTANYLSGYFE